MRTLKAKFRSALTGWRGEWSTDRRSITRRPGDIGGWDTHVNEGGPTGFTAPSRAGAFPG
jgi:hypothetical protein